MYYLRVFEKFSLYLCAGIFIGGVALCPVYLLGVRYNPSNSFPRGFYKLESKDFSKGDLILACPPDTSVFRQAKERNYIGFGMCQGWYETIIKRVVGVGGDIVEINAAGVRVNSKMISNSKPIYEDRQGRALPELNLIKAVIPKNQFLVMSDYSASSFDGRYFGFIDISAIKGRIIPIWTWK